MSMQPRPQTGPAAVSLSDVLALGKPRLLQLSQDPSQTIAPSWMIPTALDTINKTNAGIQQPQPPGTVAQQVIAQAVQPPHPITQGIGGLPVQPPQPQQPGIPQPGPQAAAPMQHMAGGGSVKHFDDGGSTGYTLPKDSGWAAIKRWKDSGLPLLDYLVQDNQGTTSGVAPTAATAATVPQYNFAVPDGGVSKGMQASPADYANFTTGTPTQKPTPGVGGLGKSPLSKYGPPPTAPSLDNNLDIPKNQALADARAELEARTAANVPDMQNRTQRKSLADYAAAIGGEPGGWRGFGATNPAATRAMVTTENAGADNIQAYKDQQAALATQYGIQAAGETRADALAKAQWSRDATQKSFENSMQTATLAATSTHYGNVETLEQQRNSIMAAANALTALQRQDALNEGHMKAAATLVEMEQKRIMDEGAKRYPMAPGLELTPQGQDILAKRSAWMGTESQVSLPKLMSIFQDSAHKNLGISAFANPAPAAAAGTVRGDLK